MKARNTYSKGLIAILLLCSVACSKGFQALPSQSNERSASEHSVIPDGGPWQFSDQEEAADQAAENAPVQESTVAENKTAEQPKVEQNSNDKEVEKQETVKPKTERDPSKKTSRVAKPTEEKEDSEKPVAKAEAEKSDFTGPGRLKPTIYYFPVFNEDESKCEKDTMMHASGGKELLKVCEKTAKECGLQGSCAIVQDGVTRSFNVLGARNGQDRFFEIKDSCKYGFGVENACLDPFYTLAADLSLYEPGQVIYIPGVVGMELPDGSKHSGYFVIRDRGRGVTGTGRFDFFSGMMAWKDSKNPFTKMGLGDVKTNIPYYKVKGKTAQQVLRHRAFPKLPRK
ncbi:hypothetical protein AZI86_03350 [Bdellovibrio bacteriovorus]|uniref:3D domain-containing protein n=1 Tax=Bdellovibrio bacteriovorus TaxID=959 RepID=A0A150WNM9_BDEBC|nr:hypothetical protein [Bdellovibrio bacteriovorus]KYG66113.1 hypothetical protein AZI86_03350 [Bdellovibrio bacteriovorus]